MLQRKSSRFLVNKQAIEANDQSIDQATEDLVSENIRITIETIDVKLAVSILKKGTYLLKYCDNVFKKPHQRFFWMDMETLALKWQSPNKSQARTCFFLTDVYRIVPGVDSDFWRNKTDVERQLGIELIGHTRLLRIMCGNQDEWKTWLRGLLHAHQKAMAKRKRATSVTNDFIQRQWALADLDKNGSLSFYELIHLLQRINFRADVRYAEQLFEEFDEDGSCVLELDEFKLLFHKLLTHQDLLVYFDRYQDKRYNLVTEGGFRKFLTDVQGTPAHQVAEQVIQISSLEEPFKQDKGLTDLGFNLLLTSEFNSIINPSKKKVNKQDMMYPISHYWISTSHNTYLTGDQMIGKAAVGQYIDVLLKGCRCVELDCWDGSDGDPVIYHGHTFTNKIPFAAVIRACRDYGFKKSTYPIILSLEMHCSEKQKKRVGELLTEILDEQLYRHPPGAPLPSPYNLQNKFLVKGRIPDEFGKEVEEGNEADVLLNAEELQLKLLSQSPQTLYRQLASMNFGESMTENKRSPTQTSSKEQKDLKVYYDVISLTGKRLDLTDKNRKETDVCSLNERRLVKLTKSKPKELVAFHQKYLSRVYPSGTRLMSSNYNPMPCWIHGAQMVALNFQAHGLATLLNLGKFIENGNIGYVLKPQILRNETNIFDSSNITPHYLELVTEPKIRLNIQILAAQQLPRPIIEEKSIRKRDGLCPYVVISLHGIPKDTVTKRTPYVSNNGLNPRWKDQSFTFNITLSSLAILVFEVRHYDTVRSTFVAGASVPVSAIRSGIRWVELHDAKLRPIPWSGLLVQTSMKVTKTTLLDLQPASSMS